MVAKFLVCYAILNAVVQIEGLGSVDNVTSLEVEVEVEAVATKARERREALATNGTTLQMLHRNRRIYNGDDAQEGGFPFMVRVTVGITFYNNGTISSSGMCGGSIISPRVILTAAHCVVVKRNKWNELRNPANIKVTVGDHTTGSQDTNERDLKVEGLIVHEEYNTVSHANDIAMIVLAGNIEFGEGVATIRIPDDDDEMLYEAGSKVTVAGWGGVETGGIADTLQTMDYTFSSSLYCNIFWYYLSLKRIHDGMVCTDRMPTPEGSYAHIWHGDSGSAIFVKNDDGSFTQLALVSWSTSLVQVPAPDVHTNVFYYRHWIREHIGALNTTYLQSLEASYGVSDPALVFTDLRHFLYRRTNVYTSIKGYIIAANVFINGFAPNHFVQIYDGADIESDMMVAMLPLNKEYHSTLYSSTNKGFTFVVQTNDKGDLSGSVTVTYKATEEFSRPPLTDLICPNEFWACLDRLYCIRKWDVCDNTQGVAGQCRDGSDEELGCVEEEEKEKNNTPDQEGWISVYHGKAHSFSWNYSINSIAIQTSSYKGSWDVIVVEINHKTANNPVLFGIRFGGLQLYIRVYDCTEYGFGMDYPTTNPSTSEYIISFNEEFMSVIGNGEVLWNLDYKGNLAMDSCYNTVHGMSNRGTFKREDTASIKYKIMAKPENDRLYRKPGTGDAMPMDYCSFESVEFNCDLKIDPWRSIDGFFVDFQWDTAELSLDLRTGYGESSELVQLIGFFENEEKFSEFKYIALYYGKTHLWVWIKNCTEYWIPLEYPANRLYDNQYSFTFSFHEQYASVLGNGKVIWNFNFTGSIAMKSCLDTVKMYYPSAFVYYDNKQPMVGDRFRLLGRLHNDTMGTKPDPEFADFSRLDDKEFKEFPPNELLTYDFIRTPLQLKTEADLPVKSNISISLFASNSTILGSMDIGFLEFTAFYMISNCNERHILFEIPDPLPGSTRTRIWTIDTTEDVIVLRCNGLEFGRVERGSDLVLSSCGELFEGEVSSISIAAPVRILYKVLENWDVHVCEAPIVSGGALQKTGNLPVGEHYIITCNEGNMFDLETQEVYKSPNTADVVCVQQDSDTITNVNLPAVHCYSGCATIKGFSGTIEPAVTESGGAPYSEDQVITFECQPNYQLENSGERQQTCTGGQISKIPKCIPKKVNPTDDPGPEPSTDPDSSTGIAISLLVLSISQLILWTL